MGITDNDLYALQALRLTSNRSPISARKGSSMNHPLESPRGSPLGFRNEIKTAKEIMELGVF